MKTQRAWHGISIRIKAAVTQILMIVIPLCLCTWLIGQQITSESHSNNAASMHAHNHSMIQNLDTSIRQLEMLANTIGGNISVRTYVANTSEEQPASQYPDSIKNLLNYSYNRYLPTRQIDILPQTTLAALTPNTDIVFERGTQRMWTFTTIDNQIVSQYYYQFAGVDGSTGVLRFSPTNAMLLDVLTSMSAMGNQTCGIFDAEGHCLMSHGTGEDSDLLRLDEYALGAAEGYAVLDKDYVGYCVTSETLPLRFISIQQLSASTNLSQLFWPILLTVIVVAGCVLFSYQALFSSITKRILSLSDACSTIAAKLDKEPDKDEHTSIQAMQVPSMGSDEIGDLSSSINDMLSRITELTVINEREVMISQRAAYDMLAAQIHPHFIYNTLENLRMMAETNDDEQVADMLYALGRMLRLSISDASSTGEVSVELEHVQTYLKLQQMRMNGLLDYTIDVTDESIIHQKCPRFLLQPMVENAIKHGFRQRKTTGHICITSGRYEKGIYLKVTDDGCGMEPERLAEVNQALSGNGSISDVRQGGIGLTNVRARLRMFYGPDAGITIHSEVGKGTECTLWLAINSQNRPASLVDGTPQA